MINIGTSTINAVKLGTTNISAVYIGTTQIYPALNWFYLEDASGAANTVSIVKNDANAPTLTIETSTNGATWTTAGTTGTTALNISVPANGKVYVRCNANSWGDSTYYNVVSSTGDFNIGGNSMSLIYGSNFTGRETSFPASSTRSFYNMFYGASHLVDASTLELPATALVDNCYYGMFQGCTALTAAPALPATTLSTGCYQQMFMGCTNLTSRPTTLPATTLAGYCYQGMFESCSSLTSAPALPATTLASNCYYGMFKGCSLITTTPTLPATTLTLKCYQNMFRDCTSLTSAPALPATTLADDCYNGMFMGCTALTTASELPATTLPAGCYGSMYRNTAITTAPLLPATTLGERCYGYMFHGCTSLTSAPATLPATTFANNCYQAMFRGCSRLTSAPVINGVTPVSNCLVEMFRDCPLINSVRTKATTWNDTYASNWLSGVAATGTLYNDGNATIPTSSASGVPTGWSVVNNIDYFYFEDASGSANTVSIKKGYSSAPTLTIETSTNKATWTTLGSTSTTALNISIPANGKVYVRCTADSWGDSNSYNVVSSTGEFNVGGNIMSLLYGSNFTGSETSFPSGSTRSFYRMFYTATRLVDASALRLPATTLVAYCYYGMFQGCTALTAAPALPATTLAGYCYELMFEGCTALTTAPTLPATTLKYMCYAYMFSGCTALKSIKVAFTSWPNFTSSTGSANDATYRWTHGLPASGTFYKKSGLSTQKNASGNTTTGDTIANCTNAIPYNWTVTNY